MNLAFWASFGRIQENISYLTDNFPKQGYKILFFPYPAATMFNFKESLYFCNFILLNVIEYMHMKSDVL